MNRVNIIIRICFLFTSITAFGQTDSTFVPFIADWAKGDCYKFKITEIKEEWFDGILERRDSFSYMVNFEVLDSSDDYYRIKWSHKNNLKKINIAPDLEEAFSTDYKMDVIYKTDNLGEFIEIENWIEILARMQYYFEDAIDKTFTEDEQNRKEEMIQRMQPILEVYETKEGIEQLAYNEIFLLHYPLGGEYSMSEPLIYEVELDNLLGGDPLRGDVKLYVDSVNVEDAYCVLVEETTLNAEDARNISLELLKKMKLKDKEMKKAIKNAKIDISTHSSYEYYYSPATPIKVEKVRKSLVFILGQDVKNIQKVRIELVE